LHDYTGYLFDFPTQHYKEGFKLFADCMENCLFDDDMLNSEMKAVIQELKLGKDHYNRDLTKKMIETIFADHPYHYSIIGYKQNLWNVSGADLKAFYKKHYKPNNATLVVVGDVDEKEVVACAEKYFGSIKADPEYKKQEFFFDEDIVAKSVKIYRDVQQSMFMYAWVIPGSRNKQDHIVHLAEWIIGSGNGSRLYKKLVNKLQLVTSMDIGTWNLFDHSVFFIDCEPVEGVSSQKYSKLLMNYNTAHNGLQNKS
jgi:predicted Zn-dependent peptidase